jgi:hypothetical protein
LLSTEVVCSAVALWRLVLLVAQVLVLARQDHGPAVDPVEGLGGNGGAVCADRGTNGHEEAVASVSVCMWGDSRGAYPKVAAEPAMYCPRVRSIPLGPGPKRTMLVNPGAVSVLVQ